MSEYLQRLKDGERCFAESANKYFRLLNEGVKFLDLNEDEQLEIILSNIRFARWINKHKPMADMIIKTFPEFLDEEFTGDNCA